VPLLRLLKIIAGIALAGALAAAGYAAWYVATPVAVDRVPLEFEIPSGSGLRAAVQRIEKAGAAVGPLRFELLARMLDRARDIKAGSYELGAAPTPLELLRKLTRGDVSQTEIRFIGGWTFRQVRAALDAHEFVRHDTRGLDEAAVLARLGVPETHPEGLFFPDTYLFGKGTKDLHILARAYRAMLRHLEREWESRDQRTPYRSAYDALIMASIVEKETGRAAERELIGAVLVNRLKAGMPLQADPTVIYGLGERFDGNLKKIHLLADGPYNTYTRAGLPPTPIALPGLGALRAALRPAQTDALYYVARGDGSSEFSRTLEEHNRAVRKYQLHGAR
jgi:UPF0755 protein